jgi:hypothetical protein
MITVSIPAIGSGWYKYYTRFAPEEQEGKKVIAPILVAMMVLTIVIMEVWFR